MGLQDYLQGNIITLSGDPDNVKTFNPELYKSGEGSKRLKRFFDELWNKKYSVDRLCKEHQLKYKLQIGE